MLLGTVQQLKYYPNFYLSAPKIRAYEWDNKTFEATLLHETDLEDIPMVLYAWKDRILAGIGKCLRYYDIGKKRLLRKA